MDRALWVKIHNIIHVLYHIERERNDRLRNTKDYANIIKSPGYFERDSKCRMWYHSHVVRSKSEIFTGRRRFGIVRLPRRNRAYQEMDSTRIRLSKKSCQFGNEMQFFFFWNAVRHWRFKHTARISRHAAIAFIIVYSGTRQTSVNSLQRLWSPSGSVFFSA